LASSSATVAAEVHFFWLLAAFFQVIDTQSLSLSSSLASGCCEVSCDSWVGGWAGARHLHGYGKKMLLKKRETTLCIPDDDPWMRFVRFVYGVIMLPEERFDRFMHWVIILEGWGLREICALVMIPCRERFEWDLCIWA
jgi:hypothetical protein